MQDPSPPSINQLLAELQEKGYQHSRSTLYGWVCQLRHELGLTTPAQIRREPSRKMSHLTPRRLATIVMMPAHNRSTEHKQWLDSLVQREPTIAAATDIAAQFIDALRQRKDDFLNDWLATTKRSTASYLSGFAKGIELDLAAVQAAFTSEFSNGQVEGQINRLKIIKRMMYDRAGFQLLRKCVLWHGRLTFT
ncbi:MAG: transposase [Anaerolineae bacterium]|nr:transposase [Anaerolineae bacterium]MCO5188148.1 transposase [Anaerolineae bacterium]MCO5193021.1 transposase [Anaerolineae bacterium]MCO5205623.1 transposase [Anaerolineae bacterium]